MDILLPADRADGAGRAGRGARCALTLALLAGCGGALGADAVPAPWSARATLVSDYRYRGVSQSWREPALQAELQYEHASGGYAGAWASQVSPNVYPGARVEVDLYAGYGRGLARDLGIDAGLVRYAHPGARDTPEPGSAAERFDGTVAYVDLAWRAFGVEVRQGLGGGARGSSYVALRADFEPAAGWTLGLHAGKQALRDAPEYEYRDWGARLAREVGRWTLGAAYSSTDADRELYSVAGRQLAGPAWVLWVSRAF